MASLVTFSDDDDDDDDDDYKIIPEEIWVLKEGKKNEFYDKVKVTEIKYDRVLGVYYVHYKSISDLNEVEDSFLSKRKFLDLYKLDLDDFELEATSSNDGDLPDINELLDMDNISKYNNNDNAFKVSNEKKNDTDKLKPNKKRAANKVPTTSQRKQKRRIHRRREKIHWEFLSRDYNTLFYPKYKGKVVPQVMTITKVLEKELDKRTKQRKKYKSIKRTKVYIFAIKDPNTNIDKRIETWTAWRKDRDAVNNWIKQIKRIKKKCKTDPTKSNFLKALQRSFTIDRRGLFKETKFDPLKVAMVVCYVHFIKNKGTDHTWDPFKKYFEANCDALKKIFDTLKAKKFEENLNNVKDINNIKEVSQANTGLNKFASVIFHKDIEYVKDETFDVLGEKEEQTKQQLARMFDIDISTGNTMGGFTSMLMTKLKF